MMKDWIILPQIREKARLLTSLLPNTILEVLVNETGQGKKKKTSKLDKMLLFTDDVFVYVRNLMEFTKKLVEAINEQTQEFCKI